MNGREKEALIANRSFLSKNVIWTPELADKLHQDGLVTEYMLKDIEKNEKREEKVQALLDVLPIRGAKAFEKFCDILQVTGHFFLSDFLRDEGLRDEVNRGDASDTKDIYKRLPFLDKNLRDFEKKKLETYIIDKVKEEIVKQSWKAEFTEKDKTLDAKEKQILMSIEYEEEKKVKDSTISEQLVKMKEAAEEVSLLKTQLKALKNAMAQQQADHKEQFNRQIKFNVANDSSLKRVQDRLQQQEETLETVRKKINTVHGVGKRTMEKDEIAVAEYEFTYLLDDLEKVLEKIRHLNDIQEKYDTLLEEREWIMMHLGFQDGDGPSLLHAYKQFAITNDENIHALRREVAKYSDMIKENETKNQDDEVVKEKKVSVTSAWQTAVMSILKKQVQDLKTALKQKDKKVEVLENEVNTLKTKLKEMERQNIDGSDNFSRTLEGGLNSQDAVPSWMVEHTEKKRSYKNSFLPPLPNVSPVENSVISHSRVRVPPGVTGGADKMGMSRSLPFPDGLTTTTLKVGNKVKYGQPYHSMSHGLGNLKAMHPRNKYAFEMDDKAIIGKKLR